MVIGRNIIYMIRKSYKEINEKIKNGTAVVVTAEEVVELVDKIGIEEATKKVDVVTTATFGPMCSSGVFINLKQSDPPIKISRAWLNGVPAYSGLASVDVYLGATERKMEEGTLYGGAHVIYSLIKGEKIHVDALGEITDCKEKKEWHFDTNINDLGECILFNPRNAYQNYNACTNSTNCEKRTYMGTLFPNYGNIRYATTGELSPLLNDPDFRVIGVGTRIFIGGSVGYIAWNGTQHNLKQEKSDKGVPIGPGGTLSIIGNLKEMREEYIKPMAIPGYGVSLCIGIGIPIPIIDEKVMQAVSIKNSQIYTKILDYGISKKERDVVKVVNYEELKSGRVTIEGKEVVTQPVSSLSKARKIANELKNWITSGKFLMQEPVHRLSGEGEMNRNV